MINSNKKIILITLLMVSLILICSSGSVLAEKRDLEITYPTIPGAETPGPETTLPEYIKYIFNFAIIIGGILAFATLVFGGFMYLSSAGSAAMLGEAKSQISAGIFGLVLLLFSYLILITINPQLVIFGEMEPLKPVTGIYLINVDDEKKYYSGSTPSFSGFEPISIEFISPPRELDAVFAYEEEGFKGTLQKIDNFAVGAGVIPFSGKSVEFFWNRPGIYLYEKTNFNENDPWSRPPLHLSGSMSNLGDWKNKAKSLKFKNISDEILYGTVLFTEDEYRGNCSLAYYKDIENLSMEYNEGFYLPGKLNTFSSLLVFDMKEPPESLGTITFYDESNCRGNKRVFASYKGGLLYGLTYNDCFITEFGSAQTLDKMNCCFEGFEATCSAEPEQQLHKNILSFRVDGNFKVVLNSAPKFAGKCDATIEKDKDSTCYYFFSGHSDIFDPETGSLVESIIIIPTGI